MDDKQDDIKQAIVSSDESVSVVDSEDSSSISEVDDIVEELLSPSDGQLVLLEEALLVLLSFCAKGRQRGGALDLRAWCIYASTAR